MSSAITIRPSANNGNSPVAQDHQIHLEELGTGTIHLGGGFGRDVVPLSNTEKTEKAEFQARLQALEIPLSSCLQQVFSKHVSSSGIENAAQLAANFDLSKNFVSLNARTGVVTFRLSDGKLFTTRVSEREMTDGNLQLLDAFRKLFAAYTRYPSSVPLLPVDSQYVSGAGPTSFVEMPSLYTSRMKKFSQSFSSLLEKETLSKEAINLLENIAGKALSEKEEAWYEDVIKKASKTMGCMRNEIAQRIATCEAELQKLQGNLLASYVLKKMQGQLLHWQKLASHLDTFDNAAFLIALKAHKMTEGLVNLEDIYRNIHDLSKKMEEIFQKDYRSFSDRAVSLIKDSTKPLDEVEKRYVKDAILAGVARTAVQDWIYQGQIPKDPMITRFILFINAASNSNDHYHILFDGMLKSDEPSDYFPGIENFAVSGWKEHDHNAPMLRDDLPR